MPTILQQGPAPAQPGTPEENLKRKAVVWRKKDVTHLQNKRDRDAGRAEYRARQDLREAVDTLNAKAGQP